MPAVPSPAATGFHPEIDAYLDELDILLLKLPPPPSSLTTKLPEIKQSTAMLVKHWGQGATKQRHGKLEAAVGVHVHGTCLNTCCCHGHMGLSSVQCPALPLLILAVGEQAGMS